MNATSSLVEKRATISIGRMAFITFVGPLIGILAYLAVGLSMERPPDMGWELLELVVFVLLLGWPLGVVPSAMAAIAWRVIPLPASRMGRLVLALLVGAVAGPLGMALLMKFLLKVEPMTWTLGLMFAGVGALAMAATALPFSRH